MHIMSTNFAKSLVWKHGYDVKLRRHKQRIPNTNDNHMQMPPPPWNFLRTPLLLIWPSVKISLTPLAYIKPSASAYYEWYFVVQVTWTMNTRSDMKRKYMNTDKAPLKEPELTSVEWVAAQRCKVSTLTFYNIHRNRRLGLSPRSPSRHWLKHIKENVRFCCPLILLLRW